MQGSTPKLLPALLAGVGANWGAVMGANDPALEMFQPARSSVQAALSPDNITRSNHSETMYCGQEVEWLPQKHLVGLAEKLQV